jgi:hypothetical protein
VQVIDMDFPKIKEVDDKLSPLRKEQGKVSDFT